MFFFDTTHTRARVGIESETSHIEESLYMSVHHWNVSEGIVDNVLYSNKHSKYQDRPCLQVHD